MLPDPSGSADSGPEGLPGRQTLRTRRRQLIQDDIARIAIRMFLERGYDAVSVDDIAAAAGMSQRTFFRYFPTKDEVLRRYRRSLREALLSALQGRPAQEGTVAALRAAYGQTSEVDASSRPRVHALARLLIEASDVWAKDMGETILDDSVPAELSRRAGADTDGLRVTVLAAAISSAALIGWNNWVTSDGTDNPADYVVAAIDMLGLDISD